MRDALGNIRTVTDGNVSVAESRRYSPYGEVEGGTSQTVYGFTGEPTDSTGFVHLRARYYNPAIGQFFTLDPAETANRYAYVDGNPVNRRDPTGLNPAVIDGGGGRNGCWPPGSFCLGKELYYCSGKGSMAHLRTCEDGCSNGQCLYIPDGGTTPGTPSPETTVAPTNPPPSGPSPADIAAEQKRREDERQRAILQAQQQAAEMGYTDPVFGGCAYQDTTITNMTLSLPSGSLEYDADRQAYTNRRSVMEPVTSGATTEQIIDWMYTWEGRNIWLADVYNIDMPSDAKLQAMMWFTLGYNSRFDVPNDEIFILFYQSPSTEEVFVQPRATSKTYGDSSGNHVGDDHLCGAYAVSPEKLWELEDMFGGMP